MGAPINRSIIRMIFWSATIAMGLVIFIVPAGKSPQEPMEILYALFLFVSLGDLIVIKFLDIQMRRQAASVAPDKSVRTSNLTPATAPIVFLATAFSPMVIGLVYRLIGGSIGRSLSFAAFSAAGYMLTEALLLSNDGCTGDRISEEEDKLS